MSIKLNTRQVGNVTIVDVAGRLTLGEGSQLLRQTLEKLIYDRTLEKHEYELEGQFMGWPKGGKTVQILINLGEMNYIDSSGIGELVQNGDKARLNGGEIKLLNIGTRGKTLLQITKLYTKFDVHQDEAGAIRNFGILRATTR